MLINVCCSDFEALQNLTCHGGIYDNNLTTNCVNCPTWLINKPSPPSPPSRPTSPT